MKIQKPDTADQKYLQCNHTTVSFELTSVDNGIQICIHLLSSVSMLLTNTTHNIN